MKPATLRLGRLALLLTAAAGPWCEAGAGARARDRLAARADAGFDDWDVDLHGLHLFGAYASVRDQILGADEVVVGVADGGVHIDVLGLRSDPRPATDTTSPAPSSTDGPAASPTPTRDRFRIANAGVPIHVRTAGTLRLPLPGGLELAVHDPSLVVDTAGWPTLGASATVRGAAADDLVIPQVSATRSAGVWTIAGIATAPDGTPVTMDGRVDAEARTLTLTDEAGGSVALGHTPGAAAVRVDAHEFAVSRAGPVVATLLGAHGIELDAARLSGALEVHAGAAKRVHAEDFVVDGVVVVDPRISAKPVRLGAVSIDGDATLADGRVEFQLVVGHGEARIAVGGHASADAVSVDLDLASMPCDALLGAMPGGTADALVGMRLAGDISASAHLAVSRAELERARAGDSDDGTVGELTLDFPFLERCRTIADPANVDLTALRGPYRHRFADDDGRVRERVLAPGAPQFVPLGRVPKLASAFIALEDMRYWYHDGFDREQIERAFWHNVVSGRVRRGASTISQQTARNLWLGVDRSLARKLQEAYLTSRLETAVSKTRILELYVNLVELGPGVYGVDAAAQFYFGKPATELDVLQAVHIASMAPAPRTYAEKWERGEVDRAWLDELRGHVRRMHRNRMIRDTDLRAALHGELGLVDRSR